jgi:transcriptional regulator with XRE-family HTH domain
VIPIRSLLDAQLAHRALRTNAGLSRAQIAEKLRISYQTVKTREDGGSGFGIPALIDLAAAFGLTVVLVADGERPGCCEHCRHTVQVLDGLKPHRRQMTFGTAWNRLYDALAAATRRAA